MPIVLFVLFAVAALLLVSGGYVFVIGCVRKKELPWLDEEKIQKTAYGKYYQYMVIADTWLKAHDVQDVWITSSDGLKLHGLWIPANDAKGTVLMAHGYRSTMLADFALALDFYHSHGINMLIPDQRSHGKSEGKYITFGVKESDDMQHWLQYHNRQYGTCPVVLVGMSMGASTMLYLADADLPDNVKGIIADCGFTSPKDILSSVFDRVTHLPSAPSIWVAGIFTKLFAGFGLNDKDSRKALKSSCLPVVLVHGTDDGFVPCEMAQQAYDACSGSKQILLVDGADHGVSFLVDREGYTAIVEDFLNTYMR